MDRKSVLVVDDDPAILRTVGRALDVQGYDVMTAGNGSVALDVAHEREPSLIVLDLAMPVLDGCAFLASYQPATPVIVISGRQPDRAWLCPESVVGFVPKPFDLDDLLRLVERQLQDLAPRAEQIDETAELLRRVAVERDVASFERLYERHAAAAFGLCLRLTSDRMWRCPWAR